MTARITYDHAAGTYSEKLTVELTAFPTVDPTDHAEATAAVFERAHAVIHPTEQPDPELATDDDLPDGLTIDQNGLLNWQGTNYVRQTDPAKRLVAVDAAAKAIAEATGFDWDDIIPQARDQFRNRAIAALNAYHEAAL